MANCPFRFTAGTERENGDPGGGGGKGSGEGLGAPVPTLSFYRKAWLQTEARVVREKQEGSCFQTLNVVQARKEDTPHKQGWKWERGVLGSLCLELCPVGCDHCRFTFSVLL